MNWIIVKQRVLKEARIKEDDIKDRTTFRQKVVKWVVRL